MKEIGVGIIGQGFIGSVHAEAVRRVAGVKLVAVCDEDGALAAQQAGLYGCKAYSSYADILNDPEVDAIHNCTPNYLHYEINRTALEKGKHVLCEKPMTMNAEEAKKLAELARRNPKLAAGVNFNYRMYPIIQEYKRRMASGELGKPWLIHGRYLQDCRMYDTDYNWRVNRQTGGNALTMADIGVHWCDLAQTLTGSRITDVMADLATVVPVRKKPNGEQVAVDLDDYGAVLVRFDNGASGVFYVSQVSAGHNNSLEIEVNTDRCSIAWKQEENELMRIGDREIGTLTVSRSRSSPYASLPAGHPEGFDDAFKNCFSSFYGYIHGGCRNPHPDFATFEDGLSTMNIMDAILKSSSAKTWVPVEK